MSVLTGNRIAMSASAVGAVIAATMPKSVKVVPSEPSVLSAAIGQTAANAISAPTQSM
jgi:hypothetical protein